MHAELCGAERDSKPWSFSRPLLTSHNRIHLVLVHETARGRRARQCTPRRGTQFRTVVNRRVMQEVNFDVQLRNVHSFGSCEPVVALSDGEEVARSIKTMVAGVQPKLYAFR